MYYLRQHQFSQLALLTVQILPFMGKAMVQHLGLLSEGEGAPQGTTLIKQAAGFNGARSHLPFLLDYIPGTAVSSRSHLVTVMHAGV